MSARLRLRAARKPGKLPWHTVAAKYALEYGFDPLEVHADAIRAGQRVLVHDDSSRPAEPRRRPSSSSSSSAGGRRRCRFIIELDFLNGREQLAGYDVFSLIQY